jgi:glycogen(starch) synthase
LKLLISSHAFSPSIGGIETVTELLANEFLRSGYSVTVLTQTPTDGADQFAYPVVRRPSLRKLSALIAWSDIFWHNNLSLRTVWPALLASKPVVITHQGSYCEAPRGIDLAQRLKHLIVRHTTSVSSSKAVAACFASHSTIIHNPYDAYRFPLETEQGERAGDLVFLGRLVSEKGVDLLLEALAALQRRGIFPNLTIVGDGPELTAVQRLAARLKLEQQVSFSGARRGEALRDILRQHRILVVPSRYDEPFGVVALEGIACGCVVVGSGGGGLPEAIGPCGLTFPNGNATDLADRLQSLLGSPNELKRLLSQAPDHLRQFHPETIAQSYLALFRSQLS